MKPHKKGIRVDDKRWNYLLKTLISGLYLTLMICTKKVRKDLTFLGHRIQPPVVSHDVSCDNNQLIYKSLDFDRYIGALEPRTFRK